MHWQGETENRECLSGDKGTLFPDFNFAKLKHVNLSSQIFNSQEKSDKGNFT